MQKGTSHSATTRAEKAVKAPRGRPQLPALRPDPSKRVAEIFEETVACLVELGVDYAGDRGVVEAYAGELAMLEYCDGFMATAAFEPIVFNTQGNQVPHPLITIRRNAAAGVHKYGSALGLAPSARANLQARKDDEGDDDGLI